MSPWDPEITDRIEGELIQETSEGAWKKDGEETEASEEVERTPSEDTPAVAVPSLEETEKDVSTGSDPAVASEADAEQEDETRELDPSELPSSGGAGPATETSEAPEPESEPVSTKVLDPEPEDNFNWYVIRVQSGREDTVSNNLRKKLVLTKMDHLVRDIVVPKQKITEIKEGKKRVKAQKLFPGYIFIEMTLEDELWYLIRDTSGIGDFVGSHQNPTPMLENEVKRILNIMEEKEEVPEVRIDLVKNDQIKIKEGPFENFEGIVEEVNPTKGVVRVMVTIFGRETPVDLEYWQIEKL